MKKYLGMIAVLVLVLLAQFSYAEDTAQVPDWTKWKCSQLQEFLEGVPNYISYTECENGELISSIQQNVPIILAWEDGDSFYAALYKNGKWVRGARGQNYSITIAYDTSQCEFVVVDASKKSIDSVSFPFPEDTIE